MSFRRLGITFFFLLMVNDGDFGFQFAADTDDRRAFDLLDVIETLLDLRRG
jgi:hypothetical protein